MSRSSRERTGRRSRPRPLLCRSLTRALEAFQRFLFASAFEFKLDAQNRFVLPSVLRTFADLGTDVMVVGARNHLELWSPPRWSQYSAQMDQPEVLAEHLQGLGI